MVDYDVEKLVFGRLPLVVERAGVLLNLKGFLTLDKTR
jgi:hypothetical protein